MTDRSLSEVLSEIPLGQVSSFFSLALACQKLAHWQVSYWL